MPRKQLVHNPKRVVRYFISSLLLYCFILIVSLSLFASPMEVTSTFISTTRSSKYLTLTSYSPVILPASTLRRDFLGCCHSLRPSPHLRTRAGKRNSRRSYTRSPRLVVRASLDSGLILVIVAVTAFSAIAFAYCHNTFRKRKSSDEVIQIPSC